MWKRDEAVRPPQPTSPAPSPSPVTEPTPARVEATRSLERDAMVNIGKSVVIKGELSGSEDLTIEGQVDGKIELKQNVLTIGPNGRIKAQVFAKTVIVHGEVHGNITASERVDIRDNGSVDGDVSSPRVSIADGSHFRGSIDMQRGKTEGKPAAEVRPSTTAPSPAPNPPAPAGAPAPAAVR